MPRTQVAAKALRSSADAREMNRSRLPPSERPFDLLVRKTGGEERAIGVLHELSLQMGARLQRGLTGAVPDQVLAAVALIRAGIALDAVSSSLTWQEFEAFCANLLKVHGYTVKTNVVLTRPRRQIDIFAEGQTLALSVDCKHWGRSFSGWALERVATEQIERSTLYKLKRRVKVPVLPVILTLLDSQVREVVGVPVVPIFALRDFLVSVNRFDEGLAIV
ncbi:MAG: restriction endonuclease [Thaumarchaeota archaeon]|nr:restriction endonuclease [Nitrososphaerota archaeon]